MTVPVLPPELSQLRAYLQTIETRVGNLEGPQQPEIMPAMASSSLNVSNAAQFTHGIVYLTDLNQIAYSNGAHWYKVAVGSLIV